jgi:hypothetical protein
MAIVNKVAQILPGMGSGTTVSNLNVSVAAGVTNVVLNAFPTSFTKGKIRVQTLAIGVNATTKITNILVTDGTTTQQVYAGDAAQTANGQSYCEVIEWISDLNVNSINVAINVVNNTTTFDVECCCCP